METVGDKYMTVSGLPEPCIHHARSICHLALDMMEIAGQVQVDGESVQVSKEIEHLDTNSRTQLISNHIPVLGMYKQGHPERKVFVVLHSSVDMRNKLVHLFCGQNVLSTRKLQLFLFY